MNSLLIGAVLDSAFFLLHEQLRRTTLEQGRKGVGAAVSKYSPWLSFAPVVAEIPTQLVFAQAPMRGGLLSDPAILDVMADFLGGPGRAAIEELPGDPAVWLPSAKGISSSYELARPIIRGASDVMRTLFDDVVEYVVPLGGGRNRGYSTHFARGVIFRSLPADNNEYDVAIDVVHELGHQVLMVWQSVDPILASPLDAPVFSQIRRTDRPAIQTFHATVALAYMRYLELSMPGNAAMEAAALRRGKSYSGTLAHSLELSASSLRKHCVLTEVGNKMLSEMETLI